MPRTPSILLAALAISPLAAAVAGNPYVRHFGPGESLEIVIADPLADPSRRWPESLVGFPIRFPGVDLKAGELGLFDARGNRIPVQWSGMQFERDALRYGRLHVVTDLPSGGERRFVLKRVEGAAAGDDPLFGWEEPGALAVATGALQVRVPSSSEGPPDGGPIPGPLAGLALGGPWIGESVLVSPRRKLLGMETSRPDRGPLFNTYRVRYEFEGGGSYSATLRAIAGQRHVEISERIENLPESEGVELRLSFDGHGEGVAPGQRIGPFTHRGRAPCATHLQFSADGAPSLALFTREHHRWRDGIYSLHPGGDRLCVAVEGTGDRELVTRWRICSADDGSAAERHTAIALYDPSHAAALMAAHPPGEAAGSSTDFSQWLRHYHDSMSLDHFKDWVLEPRGRTRNAFVAGQPRDFGDAATARDLLFEAYGISTDLLAPASRFGLTEDPQSLAQFCLQLGRTAHCVPDHPMAAEWLDQAERILDLAARLYARPEVRAWNAQGGRPARKFVEDGTPSLASALAGIRALRSGGEWRAEAPYAPSTGKHTGYGAVLADGGGAGAIDLRLLQLDRGPNYGWAPDDAQAGGAVQFAAGGTPLSATPFSGASCELRAWDGERFRSLGAGPLDGPFDDLGSITHARVRSHDGSRSRALLFVDSGYFLVDDRFTAALSQWCWSSPGRMPPVYFAGERGDFLEQRSEEGALAVHQRRHPAGAESASLAVVAADGSLKVGGISGKPGFNDLAPHDGPIVIEGPAGRDLLFWSTGEDALRESGEDWEFEGQRGVLRRMNGGATELVLFDERAEPREPVRIGTESVTMELAGPSMAVSARHGPGAPVPDEPESVLMPVGGRYSCGQPGLLRLQFGPAPARGYQQPGRLLAYWKFDEGEGRGISDMKSPGTPAQLVGQDPAEAWVEGVGFSVQAGANMALQLDGSGLVETFFTQPLPAGFSLSFWTRGKAPGTLFAKRAAESRDAGASWLSAHLDAEARLRVQLGATELVTEAKVADGTWRHVVITGSDSELRLYIDGEPQGEATLPAARPAGPLRFGSPGGGSAGDPGTATGPLVGAIDNFRIYDFPLRQTEARALYMVGAKKSPIVITSEPARNIRVGETFNYSINYTGAPFVQFTIRGMPKWMKFEGRMTGTPGPRDVGQTAPVVIAGACPWGPAQQSFRIDVLPPLVAAPWRLYVDGRPVPTRYVGRGIEVTLPAGAGRWEFRRTAPAPAASAVLSARWGPAGVAVNARRSNGATSYRYEWSSDGGATWSPAGEPGKTPGQLLAPPGDGEHLLRVIASSGEGDSKASAAFAFRAPGPGAPPNPAAPRLERIDAGIRLRWDAVPAAASYKLYRRAAGESEWKQIHAGAGLAYIDRGATGATPPHALPGSRDNAERDPAAQTVYEYSLSVMSADTEGSRGPAASTDPASWMNWTPLPQWASEPWRRRAALWQPPITPAELAPPAAYPE